MIFLQTVLKSLTLQIFANYVLFVSGKNSVSLPSQNSFRAAKWEAIKRFLIVVVLALPAGRFAGREGSGLRRAGKVLPPLGASGKCSP